MLLNAAKELLSAFRPQATRRQLRHRRGSGWSTPVSSELSLAADRLEKRLLLSAYSVNTLNDSGAGSLRAAITAANNNAGGDTINFSVSGTITLTSGALPTISGQVVINGTSAPGFIHSPVVQINFNSFDGLHLNSSADGSALMSLGFVNAVGNGVTIDGADNTLVENNFIGLLLDGTTIAANAGNGLKVIGASDVLVRGNVISGNIGNGISLYGATKTTVEANFVGIDDTGEFDRGNLGNGIRLTAGATSNTIGGPIGNLISGNAMNGVLIDTNSTRNTVQNNIIGLNGLNDVLGNDQDGVKVDHVDGNVIGDDDQVTGISYYDATSVPTQPVSGWQGIRESSTSGQYLMVGTSNNNGLLFDGTMDGTSGTSYLVNVPNSFNTSVYGPDNLGNGNLRLVGSFKSQNYQTDPITVRGFLFEGTTAQLGQAGHYRQINYPGAQYNYIHSTDGGLVVGNDDSLTDHSGISPIGPGHAFIYDITKDEFVADIVFPGSKSNNVYGIWYNGGTSYTVVGGYSLDEVNNLGDEGQPIGKAYMVDYDSATGRFTNWASFESPQGANLVSHFEGISSVEKGVYTLSAVTAQSGTGDLLQGSWVTVRRNADGSFGQAVWVDINYPGADPTTHVTANDSVYGNQIVGVVIGGGTLFSYQATINTGFQLSNRISGNGGNGVGLYGASGNVIAQNYIGTDDFGVAGRGNGANGILITGGSTGNVIGGEATGGNDPTNNVFVRPPLGNVISGNNANGVLINGKSTDNRLSGNFIGTDETGNVALGNTLDGVAIEDADGNALLGCLFQEDPFVFYNVISGNGGNGLRVNNSDDTVIQANFFGMGANNATRVGNGLNGVVVEGNSTRTTMGGPIPLGNVVSANAQNGVVVKDTASYFITYNTFCGLAAFSDNPTFGNGADGMLITSTGGDILIRTCVIVRNGDDGIEISGQATGVRVDGNIIGLNTNGTVPMGNADNGVEVGGNAHDVVIGGPQPTFNVVPQNTISANGDNGVAIIGTAHNITVNHGYIGTDVFGEQARGNTNAGVLIDAGTYANTIGSSDPTLLTVISGNDGNGIEMCDTHGNTVIGTYIGVDAKRQNALGNGGSGVEICDSDNNTVGVALTSAGIPANIIAYNARNGVHVLSGSGNGILGNSIYNNTLLGINIEPGANTDEVAPVITEVQRLPQGVVISGSINSTANSTLRLEFFANETNSSSGRYYLGSKTVTTNGSGFAAYTFVGTIPPDGSIFFTATATDSTNNSSEFSAAGETFNIAGAWAAGNNLNSVEQDGNLLKFKDQNGVVTVGRFTSPSTVIRGQLTGKIDTTTADNGRILWSDGTTWLRLSLEGQYFNPANNKLTSVAQDGLNLTFVNAQGQTTTGTFLNTQTVSLTGWNQTATFINGVLNISNGSQWNKLDLSPNYTTSNGSNSVGIVQSGATGLVFVNRLGQSSRGQWTNPTTLVATDWNSTGTVGNGQIVWSNSAVWNKNLTVIGAASGQGTTSIFATNNQIVLTNKSGATSNATLINPTTLVALNWGNVTGSRVDDKIVWSNGTIWDNFDFNALNAVFSDIHSFPFPS